MSTGYPAFVRAPARRLASSEATFSSQLGSSQIPYLCFLLVNAAVFLRVSEMFESLEGTPVYEVLIVSCLLLSLNRLRDQARPRALYQQPITVCVLGMGVSIILSHLSHAYFSGAIESGTLFFKVTLYYLLLVSLVTTPARFRGFLLSTAACAFIMITLCVIDYLGWIDLAFVKHIEDLNGVITDLGKQEIVLRMRGTGLFQDPNDISLLIMATLMICAYFLDDRRWSFLRFVWLLPMGVLATGLYCTRSRGGLLATGAAGMTLLCCRFGKKWGMIVGGISLCALPFLAGRQGDIDLEEGTGQARIQLWSEGLHEIKSLNVFLGIGQGLYADAVGQVAHNSYVHAFVELGLLGGTLFFGCFFFVGLALYRIAKSSRRPMRNAELQRFAPFMAAIMAGWAVGVYSLSRCYVVPQYMIFGLAASYINLAGIHMVPPRLLVVWDSRHVRQLIGGGIGLLILLFIFVKIFVRFH